jgi:hypothetical protein
MYKDGAPNPFDLFSAALHLGSDGQLRTGPPRLAEGDDWQHAPDLAVPRRTRTERRVWLG